LGQTELPAEVARLITAVIASMEHVELLRLFAASPDAPFTLEMLAGALRADLHLIRGAVHDLVGAKLVSETDGQFVYAAGTRDRAAVAELIQSYNTRPVTLVRAIYARPKPVTAFADAFRIRRSD
jgi:hypothetical protein